MSQSLNKFSLRQYALDDRVTRDYMHTYYRTDAAQCFSPIQGIVARTVTAYISHPDESNHDAARQNQV